MNDAGVIDQAQHERRPRGAEPEPDVSFLIAAYNVAPFIEEAIQSGLSQTGVTVEVIVIDDASVDETAAIVERCARSDARVKLVKLAGNAGPGAARNAGLKSARGKWIAILDGDDLIVPNRTRHLLAIANATSADIVGDNFERVSVEGRPTGKFLFPQARVPFQFAVDAPTFIAANEVLGSKTFSLGAIKVMIRSDFLRNEGVLHPEDLPVGEDFRFILSCLFRRAKFVVSSDDGYKYRLRPGSQSWRLTNEHMNRLKAAYEAISGEANEVGAANAYAALEDYRRVMLRTSEFVTVVTLAKEGEPGAALAKMVGAPQVWPLAIRFGCEAILKRLKRFGSRITSGRR